MNKRIIITEVQSPYDLVVGGTLNLSSLAHSLVTRFWYKDDVRAYKISIIIYHKIFTSLAALISNTLYQSKTVTTYKKYILAVPFLRRFTH